MKQVKLTLLKSLIIEAVKGETLIKGRIDKATDDKASALAYQEEAGDEQFHERKLLRTMHTSLSKLKTKIGDYLEGICSSSGDNIFGDIESDNDAIELSILVSDRFNESFLDPLAKLCSKYIEDHMLYLWWGTFNQKQAEFYRVLCQSDLDDIMSCFTKTAPAVPVPTYTDHITTQLGSTYVCYQGDDLTLTYEVSDGCMDDVSIRLGNGNLQVTGKREKSFVLKALRSGICDAVLYSQHNDAISTEVTIVVK